MGNAREIQRSPEMSPGHEYEAPVLPPRPRPATNDEAVVPAGGPDNRNCGTCNRKYVLLCAACGGISVILGSLFSALYFVLRSYTSSLHYFETVPSYVASVVLIIMGLLTLCFGWRRNRFGYLVKLCGACCLVCAVVCVVITVTTTVIHMNRLQSLRECVYNTRGHSCTCFTRTGLTSGNFVEMLTEEGAAQYVFADTPDCEVIHGALYSCLRAMFGLSVLGILVSLFSGMLIYQLLGHERKKMYWEQLELRSRAIFQRNHPGPCCGCCQHCRMPIPSGNTMFPWTTWDVLNDNNRYWNLHGGNLYSPGPCSNTAAATSNSSSTQNAVMSRISEASGCSRRNPPWNWLPWRPSNSETANQENDGRRTAESRNSITAIGPDDHYGFPLSGNGNYRPPLAVAVTPARAYPASSGGETVSSWGPPPPYSRATNSDSGSVSLCGSADKAISKGVGPSTCERKTGEKAIAPSAVRSSGSGDPRRMPWNSQETRKLAPAAATPKKHPKPPGRESSKTDKEKSDRESSELYFADTSSYTMSVHNDAGNESATYEEISHGLRFDPSLRNQSARGEGSSLVVTTPKRCSWDGQRQPHRMADVQGQPRSRRSAEDKTFAPIVLARNEKFAPKTRWPLDGGGGLSAFGPYRRNPAQPSERNSHLTSTSSGDFYENLGRTKNAFVPATDLDDLAAIESREGAGNWSEPGTLSPDEEVAILTSNFVERNPHSDLEDLDSMGSLSENDSVIRAVHV